MVCCPGVVPLKKTGTGFLNCLLIFFLLDHSLGYIQRIIRHNTYFVARQTAFASRKKLPIHQLWRRLPWDFTSAHRGSCELTLPVHDAKGLFSAKSWLSIAFSGAFSGDIHRCRSSKAKCCGQHAIFSRVLGSIKRGERHTVSPASVPAMLLIDAGSNVVNIQDASD